MLFRFSPLPRPQRLPSPRCLHHPQPIPLLSPSRSFHASARRKADNPIPNHYETLELQSSATPAEIKRQFFALSKLHHPDKNPSDPTASTRFVAISEAYHVLSSPAKKASYDRDLHIALHPAQRHHHGSYSSHQSQGFAGSRPPSGLSRRRTQFRGPPPSFFRGGAYGAQHAKRTAQGSGASQAQSQGEGSGLGPEEGAEATHPGGFSPGQSPLHGTAVPHFDSQGHRRTHEGVSKHFKRKAERAGAHFAEDLAGSSGSMLFNFSAVGGALLVIMMSAIWLRKPDDAFVVEKKGKGKEKGRA